MWVWPLVGSSSLVCVLVVCRSVSDLSSTSSNPGVAVEIANSENENKGWSTDKNYT